jgi:HAD superfamily hydrolase (TIGR01490 family)
MPASYFDVDGTLVRTNLLHPTAHYLRTQINPVESLRFLSRAVLQGPSMVMAELRDRRLFNEMLYANFKGMTEDRLIMIAEEIHEEVMMKNMFKGTRALVQRCLDLGHEVVFVSGSLDVILAHFAKELGVQTVIANRLEIKDRKATGKILRPVVAGPEKAFLIRQHAAANGHDLNKCFAYSDSYSDVPMLSVVGYPAAVNPDKKLERLALAYQWPVLHLDGKEPASVPQPTR